MSDVILPFPLQHVVNGNGRLGAAIYDVTDSMLFLLASCITGSGGYGCHQGALRTECVIGTAGLLWWWLFRGGCARLAEAESRW